MANEIQLSIVFGGQYNFEKLQSDWNQTDTLARNYIKNKPDLNIYVKYAGATENVDLGEHSILAKSIILEGEPTNPDTGEVWYDTDTDSLAYKRIDGGITHVNQEPQGKYVNIDTVSLVNGMIVSTAAIPGNRKGIKRTDFTNIASIRSIVGMITVPSIGINQSGMITKNGGIINDLNTNGLAEGLQLWGNPSVLGGWTGNKPAKGNYAVQIGQVVVSHATVGSVELNVAKDVKFSDLADVDGTTNLIDNSDTIPKRDSDGIIREISVANVKAALKADTDLLYEPLLGFTPENVANKGQANGYASLGADGLVPSNQLPSFVDDVLEFANLAAFPNPGETGKIYVALDTNKTYRWSGSAYIYITSGAVDSVAGKTGVVTLIKGDVGLENVDNTSDANKPVSTLQQNALDLKIDKTLSSEITTIGDSETMAVKASDNIWKRITWSNIKSTLKTYFETLFVTLTGAQNIAGVKTFTDSPIVPNPVNNTDAANKAYVQSIITVGNDTYQENKLITDARVASLENVINSGNLNHETTATATGVDTIPLPKTAANGGMQVQMFGQSAQNFVVNGDFRNGTTGWQSNNLTTTIGTNGVLLSKVVAGDRAGIRSTNTDVRVISKAGDKIYTTARIRCNSLPSNNVYLAQNNGTAVIASGYSVLAQNTTEWQNVSIVGELDRTLSYIYTGLSLYASYTGSVDLVYMLMINLTAIFGPGNEITDVPTLDKLFANYFEGTDNVLGTGRVRSIGSNLFNQYNVTEGYRLTAADGNVSVSPTALISGYIPVSSSTTYLINSGIGSGAGGHCFYDANRNFISGVISSTTGAMTFTTPVLAKYVRLSLLIANKSTAKLEKGSSATAYEPYRQSTLYLTTPALRSNGLIKDEIRKGTNGYELVKRVGVGTLAEKIINGGFTTDANWIKGSTWTISGGTASVNSPEAISYLSQTVDSLVSGKWYKCSINILSTNGVAMYLRVGGNALSPIINTTGLKEFYVLSDGTTARVRANAGVIATIDDVSFKEVTAAEAIAATSTFTELGSNVHYTLATPVITPIPHAGLLNSNSNGTAYFEPIIADAGVYGSNIAIQLTDYPINSFESIRKYSNGTYTELNTATAVIASGGLSFTHPDLVSGDLVLFTYYYNKESINRSMTVTHYDSRHVKADTVNGKFYRIVPVVTNGVVSWTAVEV